MSAAPLWKRHAALAFAALFLVTGAAALGAQSSRPWQKIAGTEISWRYQWNTAWGDYDIELRSAYDYAVSLKFIVSCGRDTRTAFWSLQPGGVASFLERFPSGSAAARLSLKIVESQKQD